MVDAPLLVGVDAGTTRIRAIVFSPDGRPVAEGSAPTPVERPRPGWAEHDPGALWQAACAALREATGRIEQPGRIVAVATASVGEAFIALDRDARPVCPTIAWYDERPKAELARLQAQFGNERLAALTGLSPDPTFTLLKLLWLKANEPDAFGRTRHSLNVAHFIAFRLSGVMTCDPSLASRTLALDLERRTWAEDLIREVGIDPALFAPIRPFGTRLGSVGTDAAQATGLPAGCAVGVAGHDHITGAFAAGALAPGVLLDSMGTAEALTLPLAAPCTEPEFARRGYSQGVVEIDRPVYYVFGGFPAAGASIEWFRSLFAADVAHAALIREAASVPPGCHGVTFVPDLRGRISPVADPAARGAWFGLTADAGRADLYRAVLEGLAFEARTTLDSLTELPGLPAIEGVRAIGGNTRNDLLMRIKASVYGRPIAAAAMPEATALGAALLGGIAAGLFADGRAALAGLHATYRDVPPEPGWIGPYDARYRQVYRPAYAALRPLHHALPGSP